MVGDVILVVIVVFWFKKSEDIEIGVSLFGQDSGTYIYFPDVRGRIFALPGVCSGFHLFDPCRQSGFAIPSGCRSESREVGTGFKSVACVPGAWNIILPVFPWRAVLICCVVVPQPGHKSGCTLAIHMYHECGRGSGVVYLMVMSVVAVARVSCGPPGV